MQYLIIVVSKPELIRRVITQMGDGIKHFYILYSKDLICIIYLFLIQYDFTPMGFTPYTFPFTSKTQNCFFTK